MSRPDSIVYRKCFNHPDREAVAVCQRCRRFFCRECVTEHDGGIRCAACLNKPAALSRQKHPVLTVAGLTVAALAGILIAWAVFFYFGTFLLQLPSTFHEGTLWSS